MLSLKQISVIRNQQHILRQISLDIPEGRFVTVIGLSGSGKSTLLRVLNSLIDPSNGEIYLGEKSYQEWDILDLRKQVNLTIQKPYLFGETVEDNLTFPFEVLKVGVDRVRIEEFLREFNLPVGILQKKPQDLSGGEAQRISLIRGLLMDPRVLLLDEVTASLDPVNARLVEDYLLKQKYSGKTVVMVTHNLLQARRLGDYTLYLKDGEIRHYLPTTELFALADEDFQKFQNSQS